MDRPIEAAAVGVMDNWPKASIGNYKGVMLCNRPNEFGQHKKNITGGSAPFNPRARGHEPLGWNKPAKLLPRANKKKAISGILLKHK